MLLYTSLILVPIILTPVELLSKKLYIFLSLFLIWIVIAFRALTVGSDTLTYAQLYGQLAAQNLSGSSLLELVNGRFELGYVLLNKFLYVITPNPRILLIFAATIEMIAIGYFINKFSTSQSLSIILFITMNFLAFSMNALRQCLALTLVVLAVAFLIENNDWMYLVMVIGASFFHKTALIMLILYPIWKMKLTKKIVIAIFLVTIVVIFLFEKWFGFLTTSIDSYNGYQASAIGDGGGSTALYVKICILIAIIIFSCMSNRPKMEDTGIKPEFNLKIWKFFIVMLCISISITLIALQYSQINRIATYFDIAYLVLIPRAISTTKNANIRFLEHLCVIVMSSAYFLVVQLYRPEWFGIIPYHFGWL